MIHWVMVQFSNLIHTCIGSIACISRTSIWFLKHGWSLRLFAIAQIIIILVIELGVGVIVFLSAVCGGSYHGVLGMRGLNHLSLTATVLTELIVTFIIVFIVA